MVSRQNFSSGFVIAITGAAGAGKTSLTRRVAELLDDAVALHFDDYKSVADYPQLTEMAQRVENGKDVDAWKIPQLLDDLKALRAGQSILLPENKGEVGPAKIIVLEEPTGRARAGLRELIDFVVWLDIPLDIGLARKVIENLNYCLDQVPPEELAATLQRAIYYFSHYPLAREYYLTVIEHVRQDCDLALDGTRPTDELAGEIVEAVRSQST